MPIIAVQVAREQPEHLRDYFMTRVHHYRECNLKQLKAFDPQYLAVE